MKRIQWGFIGCGEVAEKKSGPAFNDVEGSKVVAVMSRTERRARSYAERHHIEKWYTDAQQIIDDPDVNAIYIATPPASHATYAIMAMKAGKPVYVEKPLAATYDDCARINRVSEQTGVPCFVAYYRRYLPYFQKVKDIIKNGEIGKIINVQVRYACPPRDIDYAKPEQLPWRLRPEISGGGYFYDLAPHQLDLLQEFFGVIVDAKGFCANRGGLYQAEDTLSACFRFENGLPGSGSWCFVGHEAAREDRIEVIGDKGIVLFSVFNYEPIQLFNTEGTTTIEVPNPPYVQLPIIKAVIQHLQGIDVCTATSVSATPVNWVLDRILGKF
ncbi:MAG: Gfo/Idh/MocA family oxidoreductase [Prevotella sp.]|nr:Gfo/Idh/MocA family oxidoreductase [Prevotella sp.]MBQ4294957.1 Gfo/Idh/MocA family oxidoreductase [Prevotella sp.]MBR7053781.1 Gfo/Idh/MocA family oxidoreductase [Prevotella sp.]